MHAGGIRRFFQPSVIQNEKDISYPLRDLMRSEAKEILSAPLAGGGVFGLEGHKNQYDNSLSFFMPPYMKSNWIAGDRDPIFESLDMYRKEAMFVQFYTEKSSFFPVSMSHTSSLWEDLQEQVPQHIGIVYQVLLAYRQDNWKSRMKEQYQDYLNGVQSPSESTLMRRIQQRMSESLDDFLKWEFNYAPIQETETKLLENGFRYNIRVGLYGGSKLDRRDAMKGIHSTLREMEYVNKWNISANLFIDDAIQNIKQRKLDNLGKHLVLTVSEVLPFLMSESIVHIQKPTIVGEIKMAPGNPFDMLPVGSVMKKTNGAHIAEKFIHALKELGKVKSEMVSKRTQAGPTMMKVVFELPEGLKLSDITKKIMIEDIQTYMGVKNLRITQGENIGEVDVWLPQEKRHKVFLRDHVSTKEFMDFAKQNPLPFFVGVDEIGNPIFKCFNKIRHILVAGTTGSGKSVWVNQLIMTLLLIRKPEELQFYMIDVKQVELPIYEDFPHVQEVITDASRAIVVLQRLIAEMNRRYTLFKEAEVKNIGLYNRKCPDEKMPYIICVIDEYAELALRTDEVHDLVQSMSQLARAAGIHLLIATQDPRVEVIPGIIKNNIPGKIGFRCTGTGYSTFLNTKPPFNLLGHGDGTMCFEGQMEEHIRFQGSLIIDDPGDNDLEGELIRKIAGMMGSHKKGELPEVEVVEEEAEIDRLKRMMATTGETRVSQLRDLMKININRLNDLMKELVDEGWLQKPESKQQGYQLIATEEELKKWKR